MKLKHIPYIIIIIIIFIGYLFTYKSNEIEITKNIVYDESKNYHYVPYTDQGTSLGLVNENYDELIEIRNFKIKEDKKFDKTLAIVNQNNYSEDYLIIPLINYQQKHIMLGNKKQNKLKITIKPKEIAFVPFSFSNLKDGFHDFIFLIIPDPYNQDLSNEYRISTTGSNLMSIRGTINKNSNNYSSNLNKTKKESSIIEKENIHNLNGLILTKSKELKPWLSESINNNTKINFNINIGNTEKENKPYAMVSFIDSNQTFINNNTIIFGEIHQNKYTTIKGVINKTDIEKNSISNYTTILIPFPYQEIDPLDPKFFIETSGRVGLDNRKN